MLRFAFYCCFQGLHWDQTFSSAICEWWSPFVFRFWNLWKIYWWYIHLYGETKALCKNFVPPCYSRRSSVHSHWWMAPSVATLLFWISCRRLELSQSVYSRPSPVPRCFGVSLSFHPWLTTLPSNDVESGVYWCEVYFRYFRWNTPQPMTWGHWPYCWGRGEVDRGVSQTSTSRDESIIVEHTSDFNNCANSGYSTVTVLCQQSMLPTQSSGFGLTLSATTTESTWKKRQLLWQRSVFESLRVLDSTGGQARLIWFLHYLCYI